MRVYADTSVFGGLFDEGFAEPTHRFFCHVAEGRFELVVSEVVHEELRGAPEDARSAYVELTTEAQSAEVSPEALALRDLYLTAGVVTPRWSADALHVALATVARCVLIVSWNFRHIMHYQKAPVYNGVNVASGYHELTICSPPEVLPYEDPPQKDD